MFLTLIFSLKKQFIVIGYDVLQVRLLKDAAELQE
jgi:hypothetical protein